jgi:hypothetical protein
MLHYLTEQQIIFRLMAFIDGGHCVRMERRCFPIVAVTPLTGCLSPTLYDRVDSID